MCALGADVVRGVTAVATSAPVATVPLPELASWAEWDENAAAFPALAAHPPLAKQFNNCQSAAVNYSHNYKNEVHYQGRIVSQTASGVRKEVSLENKEQTIFMSL